MQPLLGMNVLYDTVMRRQKLLILFSLGAAVATSSALVISILGLLRSPI